MLKTLKNMKRSQPNVFDKAIARVLSEKQLLIFCFSSLHYVLYILFTIFFTMLFCAFQRKKEITTKGTPRRMRFW